MSYDESYNDEYEGFEFQLPDYLASHREANAGDFMLLDSSTGEQISKKFVVLWADAKEGYFVEKRKTIKGIEYIAHKNKNLQIVKDDDFYNLEDED